MIPHARVIVGYGPLYKGVIHYANRQAIPFTGTRVNRYFAGVDLAISAAGYNSVEELQAANVPTLFYGLEKGFDDQFEIIGDFDLVLRLISKYKMDIIDSPLATYRLHASNERYRFEKISTELYALMCKLKCFKDIYNNKNFKTFQNNVYFNLGLATIFKKDRYGALSFIRKMNSTKHILKLFFVIFLPKKLILLLRGD